MNVHSTTSVEHSKATNATKNAAGQIAAEEVAGEQSGFLSQLSALIFGSAERAQTEGSGAAGDSALTAGGKASTDALLASESEDETSTAGESSVTDWHNPLDDKGQGADAGTRQLTTAETMAEGNRLLGKLHQASQVLAKQNGKSLPEALAANQSAQANLSGDLSDNLAASDTHLVSGDGLMVAGAKDAKADQTHKANGGGASLLNSAFGQPHPAGQSPQPTNGSAALQIDPLTSMGQSSPLNGAQPGSLLNAEVLSQVGELSPGLLTAAASGKVLSEGDSSRTSLTGIETSAAHQMASAAGQQGINNATVMRNEPPVPPQTPLQLNKEMTADDMAQRVQMMMSKNLKQVDIRLDPPELGRLHIRMNMQADGANVQFTVANQQARDALEHSMPRLREMLAQQGLQLADTSVQQQNSGQQQRYPSGAEGQSGQSVANEPFGHEENLDTHVKLDLNVAAKRDGISYYA